MARPNLDKIQYMVLITLALILLTKPNSSEGLWLLSSLGSSSSSDGGGGGLSSGQRSLDQVGQQITEQLSQDSSDVKTALSVPQQQQQQQQTSSGGFGGYGYGFGSSLSNYGTRLLSIAGIQPASIASLLNTVGDTGFRYFNIQDQCRNRAACDLGYMLFKKLSFVHNWLIRTSVRTLTDMNNIYTQSWMEGMLGRNCTTVYAACRESPLEGLMNLALLQQLAMSSGVVNSGAGAASATPVAQTATGSRRRRRR